MYVARDTKLDSEGTKGTGCAEDMRCAVRVTVIVPCNSPDDSGVFVTFLSGQVEGAVPPTTGEGKLDITAGSPGSQEPDASSSTVSFTTSPKGADCSRGKTFASSCLRGESLQETTLDFRDTAGEEIRLLFPFLPSLSAGEGSERVTSERGNVFRQISHVAGFFPAVYPYSTTESGQDPVQPVVPHLTIGQQANGSIRCASTEQGSSHSSGSSRLDHNGALGPMTHNGVFTFGRAKFAALAIRTTKVRLRRNIPTSVKLLTDLRRRGTSNGLLSVCKASFSFRRHRLRESLHMAVSALDILTDR